MGMTITINGRSLFSGNWMELFVYMSDASRHYAHVCYLNILNKGHLKAIFFIEHF